MGHGWDTAAFWIATAYSIYTFVVSIHIQQRVLLAINIDPHQRLAVCGFGLAAFFLYAGFRAWSDERELHRIAAVSVADPKAVVHVQCSGRQASVLVTNEGSLAEFYGVFSIEGMVGANRQTGLFCRWEHTDSPKAKIARGQTCRIILADLIWSHPIATAQWNIRTTTDNGAPANIEAIYSSSATTVPICRAPDILLTGAIIAEPDLVNGIQPFRVVLKAFASAEE